MDCFKRLSLFGPVIVFFFLGDMAQASESAGQSSVFSVDPLTVGGSFFMLSLFWYLCLGQKAQLYYALSLLSLCAHLLTSSYTIFIWPFTLFQSRPEITYSFVFCFLSCSLLSAVHFFGKSFETQALKRLAQFFLFLALGTPLLPANWIKDLTLAGVFLAPLALWHVSQSNSKWPQRQWIYLFMASWLPLLIQSVFVLAQRTGIQNVTSELIWGYLFVSLIQASIFIRQISKVLKQNTSLQSLNLSLIFEQRQQIEQKQELENILLGLKSQNQSKNHMFSILAHDLRSPFNGLQTLLTLIERHKLQPQQLESMLPHLREQLQNLYGVLDNLLCWSRQQMDKTHCQTQAVKLSEIVQQTQNWYAPLCEKHQLELKTQIDQGLYLYFDPYHLELILRNLLNNAIKFTPEGGQIRIYAETHPTYWSICVADTGIGMSTEQMKNLLNFQKNRPHEGLNGEKGLGLGLELVEHYAHENKARLEFRSKQGQGSTFSLVLPLSNRIEHRAQATRKTAKLTRSATSELTL